MTELKKALEELKKDFSYDKFVDLIVEPKFTDEIKEKMLDVARNMSIYKKWTKQRINDIFDPDYYEYVDDIDLNLVIVMLAEGIYGHCDESFCRCFYDDLNDIKAEEYRKLNQEIAEDPFYTDYFYEAQYYFEDWLSCEDSISLDEWKQAFLESAERYDVT